MPNLLDIQQQMQLEAEDVVQRLKLEELLADLGQPIRVGSSAMGLMVRRDIDITVVCAELNDNALSAFSQIGAALMRRTDCITAVRFRNDMGKWNAEPEKYPDGLYLGLSVTMPDGLAWTVDIWLVDEPERQPDLDHLKTLLPRLSEADRNIILGIKHALTLSEPAANRIPSVLVYEAVMDHAVRTPAEFEAWLSQNSNAR